MRFCSSTLRAVVTVIFATLYLAGHSGAQTAADCASMPEVTRVLTDCSIDDGASDLNLESAFGLDDGTENQLELFSSQVCEAASSCEPQSYDSKIPSIDITIQFELNSDAIRGSEYRNIINLSEALSHPALASKRYLVVGHTDSSGRYSYNMWLSQRRALAVVRALGEQGLPIWRLEPVGMGPNQLLYGLPANHPDHRRVTIYAID